ncbi:MAG: sigma 54-interacting transcriptional regulator [Pseudomonadota bacterium]
MSRAPIHVLAVDDDESSREMVVAFLEALGFPVEIASSGRAALERLAVEPRPDIVLLDVVMPGMDGIEVLRLYRAAGGAVPVVMVSALDEAETIIKAIRYGASDYVTKPLQHDELREVIERVVDLRPLRASTSTSVIPGIARASRNLGESGAMRRVEALIDRVADADVPILITGESGVGKDVVAREIHARSSRHDRVFVKINCAALPETLLESELFGYERGAFTGAQRAKPGQFELADGGTLFLDEIGEMPAPLQAKLLQAVQDGEFYRVGGQKKVKVDVRTIVATNRDLERAIREGTFREDLYYRLNVVQVRIPPLRERREDIPALLAHFVEKYGRRYGRTGADVPAEIVVRFLEYDWPGNVRELENLVRRLMVLRDPSYVYAEMHSSHARCANAGAQRRNIGDLHDDKASLPERDTLDVPGTPEVEKSKDAQDAEDPVAWADAKVSQGAIGMGAVSAVPSGAATKSLARPFPGGDSATARSVDTALPLGTGPTSATTAALAAVTAATVVPVRGGSYPFGGYASSAAAVPLGEVVAAEFAAAGAGGNVDLKTLGRKAADIVEREAIVAMLARTGGSKREAAVKLGISYKAILYKIREFGIGHPRGERRPPAGSG